jgi:hypothetical protein
METCKLIRVWQCGLHLPHFIRRAPRGRRPAQNFEDFGREGVEMVADDQMSGNAWSRVA